ncbi:hypothetical protein CAEBREN_08057 [Caenorhabditis brenneri]|uniref:Uncharacterized protein n=1 Tax=Caenorhabditis brenneri TaxID=135651 RepID=G0NJZ7_CAEBE|nr:hypothetical protein CAEBREN_08057 [Caenorhabditis brenneri]
MDDETYSGTDKFEHSWSRSLHHSDLKRKGDRIQSQSIRVNLPAPCQCHKSIECPTSQSESDFPWNYPSRPSNHRAGIYNGAVVQLVVVTNFWQSCPLY